MEICCALHGLGRFAVGVLILIRLHDLGIATDLRTTGVTNTLQPISTSVIPDVSEDEPDLASLAGLECAVDNGDITPVIGSELLHE